jgi:hypothetical protein
MSLDSDGYGARPLQSDVDRLLEDARTLSPSGIERVAAGWSHDHAGGGHDGWTEAERAALHALAEANRVTDWDELRNRLLDLTERHDALVSWRQEHGQTGHRAEDALLGAALALAAGRDLDARHARTLLEPMSAALPWLVEVTPRSSG